MVSAFGDGVALVAITLRLQADGARPYEIGLMLAAGVAPQVLLARRIGRLVDTLDSRRLLVAGGLIEVAVTVPLILLHAVAPIVALVGVLGVASSMTGSTWSALIPRVVGEDQLAEAVSTQQSMSVLALVAAPAVGGLLAGAFGTGLPVALDAASFVVVTVAALLVRTRRVPERTPTAEGLGGFRSGFAIIRADRVLAPLFVGVALVVLLVGMVDVVLVYLVRVTLEAGGVWYGVAEASWMVGMVGGAVGAGLVGTDRGRVRATVAGIAVACAGVAAFAVAPTVWILVPISIFGGIGNGYAGTCLSTLLLSRTADSARGRVSAAANAILGGAQGVSLLLGGAVALVLSPRAIYAIGGLLGLAAAAVLAVMHDSPESETEPVGGPRRTTESVTAG
jgi:MFS family permease